MQTIVNCSKFRHCVGNIADISVKVDISTINSDFLPIFHRKIAKKKKKENEIHQSDDGEEKKKMGIRETGCLFVGLLLGPEKEEKEDGRRLQSSLQSAA